MDVETRRAKQRAYWARKRAEKAAARARENLPPERVEALRAQDRASYERNRSAVLERKNKRRRVEPDVVRAQARASYARHREEVKAAVWARYWRGNEDLRDLWVALEALVEVKNTIPEE